MSQRARSAIAVALVVLGGVVTLAAAAAGYVNHVLVDRDGFAEKVVTAVKKPAVSEELADRLAGAIVDAAPDAVAGQRLIEDAGAKIISSGGFDFVVRRAALIAHDQAFTGAGEALTLDLADGLQLLGSIVGTQSPELRGQIEPQVEAEVVTLERGGWVGRIRSIRDTLSTLAWTLPVVALLLFAVAIVVAPRRGKAFGWAGIAVVVAAVGLVIAEVAAAVWVSRLDLASPAAVSEAVGVFLSGLLPLAIVLGLCGAVMAAAGSGRLSTDTAARVAGRGWGFLHASPPTTGRRLVRALVLLGVGGALLVEPLRVLEVLAVVTGFFVAVQGLTELIALLGGAASEHGAEQARAGRRRVVAICVGAAGVVGAAGLVAYGLARTPATAAELSHACNGAQALCDRPLDRVAFPTAHNAMSSAQDGFLDPNHRRSLVRQLDAGIRGLLIDSLMARPTDRRASALTVLDGEVRETSRREVGEGGVEALQDFLARRLAKSTGPPEPFLCHIVCELGALRMSHTLRDVRRWLEKHPREVLVIVIQDLVSPEETERVFRESGLYDLVYPWDPTDPAPTLRELIDENRRVLVMAEKDGFPSGWYQAGYRRLLKETPYDNKTVDALRSDGSCRPNRGREANPLFLVNHWVAVYPPRPSKAKTVNERAFLRDRVDRCSRIRGAFPNLIAVDFAGIGDVVQVAAEVNGVEGA